MNLVSAGVWGKAAERVLSAGVTTLLASPGAPG
jgi:hypothetical protein